MNISDLFEYALNDINLDHAYDIFRQSYEKSTGSAWSKDKFISRASNWEFYGDQDGFVSIRRQRSGMRKLVGVAGDPKSILIGLNELMSETGPLWGAVSKPLAIMAKKRGMIVPSLIFGGPTLIKTIVKFIPPEVFGGHSPELTDDGGMRFHYDDVGDTTKYLIANKEYFHEVLKMPEIKENIKKIPGIKMILSALGLNEKIDEYAENIKNQDYFVNPSKAEIFRVYKDGIINSPDPRVRGLLINDDELLLWDGFGLTHLMVKMYLLHNRKVNSNDNFTHIEIMPNCYGIIDCIYIEGNEVPITDFNSRFNTTLPPSIQRLMRNIKEAEFAFGRKLNEQLQLIPTKFNPHGLPVLKNPTLNAMMIMMNNSQHKKLRGLMYGDDLYWWRAEDGIHSDVAISLGLIDYVSFRTDLSYDRGQVRLDWACDDEYAENHPRLSRLIRELETNPIYA